MWLATQCGVSWTTSVGKEGIGQFNYSVINNQWSEYNNTIGNGEKENGHSSNFTEEGTRRKLVDLGYYVNVWIHMYIFN